MESGIEMASMMVLGANQVEEDEEDHQAGEDGGYGFLANDAHAEPRTKMDWSPMGLITS